MIGYALDRDRGNLRYTDNPVLRSDQGTANGNPLAEFHQHDPVGGLLLDVVTELKARRDGAMARHEYELAADYRHLLEETRILLEELASILAKDASAER